MPVTQNQEETLRKYIWKFHNATLEVKELNDEWQARPSFLELGTGPYGMP